MAGLDDNMDDEDTSAQAPEAGVRFKGCKKRYRPEKSIFEIKSVDIEPNPVGVGSVSISVSGTLKKDTDVHSEIQLNIRRWGTTVKKLNFDLCVGVNNGSSCPVKAGNIKFNLVRPITKKTQKGKYRLKVKVKTKGSRKLWACIKFRMVVKW